MVEHFRRTDPRYERQLEVEIVAEGKRFPVVSRNISLGGMFVDGADTLPLGTSLQVIFQVPTQPESITVMGEVRWVEKGGPGQLPGMGIRFHGLRARDVWALNRFFQT